MKMQNRDFDNHVNKIKEIYFNQPLPEESEIMQTYTTVFHKILWTLSGKNFDNLLFTYSLLLCLCSISYRTLIYILLSRHFSKLTSLLILFVYFEFPYLYPGSFEYYTKFADLETRIIIAKPHCFRSFEKLNIYFGLLPAFISFVCSLLFFVFPFTFPLALFSALVISNFSGFAMFLPFLVMSIITRRKHRKKMIVALVLLAILFHQRILTILSYLLINKFLVSMRFLVLVRSFVFVLLISLAPARGGVTRLQ